MIIFVGTDYAGGRQFHVTLSEDAVTEDLIRAVAKHESLRIGTFALHHSTSDLPLSPRSLLSKQGITHLTSIHLFIYADLQAREAAKRQAFEEEARRRGRYVAKDGKERLRRRTRKELAEIRRKEAERIPGFKKLLDDVDGFKNGRPFGLTTTTASSSNDSRKRRNNVSHDTCLSSSSISTSTSRIITTCTSPVTPTTSSTTTTPSNADTSNKQRQRIEKNTRHDLQGQKNQLLSSRPLRLRPNPSISIPSSTSKHNHHTHTRSTVTSTTANGKSNSNAGYKFGGTTTTPFTANTGNSMDNYYSYSSSSSFDGSPIPTSTSTLPTRYQQTPMHRLVENNDGDTIPVPVPEPRSARDDHEDMRWLSAPTSTLSSNIDTRSQYLPQRQPTNSPTGRPTGNGTKWEMGSYHWLGR